MVLSLPGLVGLAGLLASFPEGCIAKKQVVSG